MLSGIDHTYTTVSDLEKSERFYDVVMNILGFRKSEFQIAGERHVQHYNRHFGYVLRPARSLAAHDPYMPWASSLLPAGRCPRQTKETARRLKERNIPVSDPKLYPEYAPDYLAIFLTGPGGLRLEITNYRQERWRRHDNWQDGEG